MNMENTKRAIAQTAERLSVAVFKKDPLYSASQSFEMSIRSSAIKRHGAIIESAILDALQTSQIVTVEKVAFGTFSREIDVLCVNHDNKTVLAIDVKRGNGYHDSGKRREMVATSEDMSGELRSFFSGYSTSYRYLHYYSDTDKSHTLSITLKDLKRFTGVDVTPYVDAATMLYSRKVDEIIMERAQ